MRQKTAAVILDLPESIEGILNYLRKFVPDKPFTHFIYQTKLFFLTKFVLHLI